MASETGTLLPFRPLPLMGQPDLQTILAARLHVPLAPPTVGSLISLPDGDQIALEVSTPPGWGPKDPTVVLIHGLCGCSKSAYMVRMARKLYRQKVRAVRMNLRGCGPGRGLARELYHSGRSEDVLNVLKYLRSASPGSPLALIGFSLGGNIALKLAGELGPAAQELLVHVIAVCPPVNLLACSRRLSSRRNRLYEKYFVRVLRENAAHRHATFPDLLAPDLPHRLSVFEFDDIYTAPQCGFSGAMDYYLKCSSARLLPEVAVPCHILFAEDDPLIDSGMLDVTALPPNVRLARTSRGGHLGFLGVPGRSGGLHWMDSQLLEWLLPRLLTEPIE